MTDPQHPSGYIRGLPLELLRVVKGQRVSGVSYKMSDSPSAEFGDGSAAVHEVDHSVVLSTPAGHLVLEWSIENYDEFLSVSPDPAAGLAAKVTNIVDVTDAPQWRHMVASPIVGFGVATQRSDDGADMLWALRIDVADGASVVVALAEIEDGSLTYKPNNLAVIFRPEVAQSLEVLDAPESAWGRNLNF
jgi:hypothetical protein